MQRAWASARAAARTLPAVPGPAAAFAARVVLSFSNFARRLSRSGGGAHFRTSLRCQQFFIGRVFWSPPFASALAFNRSFLVVVFASVLFVVRLLRLMFVLQLIACERSTSLPGGNLVGSLLPALSVRKSGGAKGKTTMAHNAGPSKNDLWHPPHGGGRVRSTLHAKEMSDAKSERNFNLRPPKSIKRMR